MKHNQVFLKHILDEIDFLIRETEGKNFEEFIKDEILKRLVQGASKSSARR
jgi:uncharacterized protein with HEPN domain